MASNKEKIDFIIEKLDRHNGKIRYVQGRNYIGQLEQYRGLKKIFFLMAPSFGNIGDQAIVESTLRYLSDYYSEYKLIKIDFKETVQLLCEIKRICDVNDIIVLQGGGNIGTLYYDAEIEREIVIKQFPDNTIISMPQSFYFENSAKGKRRLKKSAKIYNSHRKLILLARDHFSFAKMQKYYMKCQVILCPDIVFYYSKFITIEIKDSRKLVLCCMRNDHEDILADKRATLINQLKEKYANLVIYDTCVPRGIPDELRKCEIDSMLTIFQASKIVITNRLHGMLFAALTNTPCIVLPSYDTKIIGAYEWIKELEYIKFVDVKNIETVTNIMDSLCSKEYDIFNWKYFREEYFNDLYHKLSKIYGSLDER